MAEYSRPLPDNRRAHANRQSASADSAKARSATATRSDKQQMRVCADLPPHPEVLAGEVGEPRRARPRRCGLHPSRGASRPPQDAVVGQRRAVILLTCEDALTQSKNLRVLSGLAQSCESWRQCHNFGVEAPNEAAKKVASDQWYGLVRRNLLNAYHARH